MENQNLTKEQLIAEILNLHKASTELMKLALKSDSPNRINALELTMYAGRSVKKLYNELNRAQVV